MEKEAVPLPITSIQIDKYLMPAEWYESALFELIDHGFLIVVDGFPAYKNGERVPDELIKKLYIPT